MTDERDGRRGALKALCAIGGAAFAGATVLPGARLLAGAPRAGAGRGEWIFAARLSTLREGEARRVSLIADRRDAWSVEKDAVLGAAWLVRKGEVVSAFSVVCPHLGCSIGARSDGTFTCPCHESSFTPEGRRVTGPSPRDLDRLETRVDGDRVFVELRRFRTGLRERVETG